MPLDFPNSPSDGNTYTSGGITWIYNASNTSWDIISGYAFQRVVLNAQAGTSYTVVLNDEQKLIQMNNSLGNTVTIPPSSSVNFAIGAQLNIVQWGAGRTVIVAGSGVTINATPGLALRAQFSVATLIKTSTDIWLAIGDLSVV